jgi:hypothetical protein
MFNPYTPAPLELRRCNVAERGMASLGVVVTDVFDDRLACLLSLSGILCARHSMTTRSIYAKQDEDEECRYSGQVGGAAVDSEGAD